LADEAEQKKVLEAFNGKEIEGRVGFAGAASG
jgi:hypothetical protein